MAGNRQKIWGKRAASESRKTPRPALSLSLTEYELQKLSMARTSYSIRTLFLVTTFSVMVLAIVILSMKLMPLRAEIERLRAEVGELTVHDPEKIYAIEIPGVSGTEWTWRIYLPKGEYVFDVRGNHGGYSKRSSQGVFSTSGKEIVVRAALTEDDEKFAVDIDGKHHWVEIGQPEDSNGLGGEWSIETTGKAGQQEWGTDSKLVLLRGKDDSRKGHADPIRFILTVGPGRSPISDAMREAIQ